MQSRPLVLFALAIALGACNDLRSNAVPAEHAIGGKIASEVFANEAVAGLARAACEGRTDEVRRLSAEGVDANSVGLEGMTPLIWATNCGSLEGVRSLLDAGANPNSAATGFHPVYVAVDNSQSEILAMLLSRGGDPNAALPDTTWTALNLAFSIGLETDNWASYEMLLDSGANINRRYGGTTTAEFAAALNVWDKVAELLERGYTRNLERIGALAEHADPAIMSDEQERWLAVVRRDLERRGVRFPVPQSAMTTPPDDE
jgi:uncharacterized protein